MREREKRPGPVIRPHSSSARFDESSGDTDLLVADLDAGHAEPVPTGRGPTSPRRPWTITGAALVAGSAVVAATALAAHLSGRPVGDLTRDANQVLDGRPSDGALSTLGIMAWSVAVGIAAISVSLVADTRDRLRLLSLAGLTAVLLVDDAYLVHDVMASNRGIPEQLVYGTYAVATAVVIGIVAPAIRRTRSTVMFACSLSLFAASVAIDVLEPDGWNDPAIIVAEDGTKFVGIVLWLVTIVVMSRALVLQPTAERR